jgi:hypothetical protein
VTNGLFILQAAKRPVSSSAPGTNTQGTKFDVPSFDMDEDEDEDDNSYAALLESSSDVSTMDEATPPKKVSVTKNQLNI